MTIATAMSTSLQSEISHSDKKWFLVVLKYKMRTLLALN